MNTKGSFPHKYSKGQVVMWGNGVYRYVQITELEPLHCDGGCPSYSVFDGPSNFSEFVGVGRTNHCVSEEVLRPLNVSESGGS
jgi:hypothetical protein